MGFKLQSYAHIFDQKRLASVSSTASGMPPKRRDKDASLFQLPRLDFDVRIDNMAAQLSQVKAAIAKVRRQERRSKMPLMPNQGLMLQAAVVYELSQDTHWAVMYVKMQQRLNMHRTTRMARDITANHIKSWWELLRNEKNFKAACADVANAHRVKADTYLIESLLFEYVQENSIKDLVIPSSVMLAKYMTAWEYRPMSEATKRKLEDLRQSKTMRKAWCQRFRRKWQVEWGVTPPGKDMTRSEMTRKAPASVREFIVSDGSEFR